MAKQKTVFICAECGYTTAKWLGRCPDCGKWNTLNEEIATPEVEAPKLKRAPGQGAPALPIAQVPDEAAMRLDTGIDELNRVLGGGIVEGSMVLVGGDPGIGKSTLLTQLSANISNTGRRVLYVSGEESARQIKLRAGRLGADKSGFWVLSETDLNIIEQRMTEVAPEVMIIDSIQTMFLPSLASAPGSVSQVRECAARIMNLSKASGVSVFLVGHVTKEGAIAGPRVLEHMVDAVLYFEGERTSQYRLLRAAKNRFGSVNELGMFEMTQVGMREVSNPSELLLNHRAQGESGCAVCAAMEGSRPLLTEVQALITPTLFGNPRRMSHGIELNRLFLLLAVLEKRAAVTLYNQDAYVNVAGGISLSEPAADLSVCAAIASSARNLLIDPDWVMIGEVGLSGELRQVNHLERRLSECARLGFKRALLPKAGLKGINPPKDLKLYPSETLFDALRELGLYRNRGKE
ncbi:MAG: DNA repair protein RadA [Clostridia bacterium]|nr:DNA repair protein RadA [Clostridia bacterium]